jgi:hypothetical protein
MEHVCTHVHEIKTRARDGKTYLQREKQTQASLSPGTTTYSEDLT